MTKVNAVEMRNVEGGAYYRCLICKSKGIKKYSLTKTGHVLHAISAHPWEAAKAAFGIVKYK
ncbi:MAG: hypothetical protein IJN65_05540 [Clostridia bacterium]|nr:hypothetical protein [Clostridia bacterium]